MVMRTKPEHFDETSVRLAGYAKALAHPARLEILRILVDRRSCVCGEVVEVLPLAQATVSQHLKALKEAGLVQGEVDGPRVCYCVNEEALERLGTELLAYVRSLSTCC